MAEKHKWQRRQGSNSDSTGGSGRSGAALLEEARAAMRGKDLPRVLELLSAALTKAHAEGDTKSEARAHALRGALRFEAEGSKAARADAEEALRLARLAGSPEAEVDALYLLGLCAQSESRHVEAYRLFEEVLPIAEKHSTPDRVRMIRNHVAMLAMHAGEMTKASAHVGIAVRGAEKPEADLEHARGLLSQGELANRLGKTAEAKRHFEDARLLSRRLDDRAGEAIALMSLGDMTMYEGDLEVAEAYVQAAREAFQREGLRASEANCLLSLGEIAYRQDEVSKAREIFARTLDLYRQVGDRLGEANCILKLGDIAREPPADDAAAQKQFAQALDIYAELRDLFSMGRARRRLAEVASTRAEAVGHWTEAIRLFESAGRPDLVQAVREDLEAETDESSAEEKPDATT